MLVRKLVQKQMQRKLLVYVYASLIDYKKNYNMKM